MLLIVALQSLLTPAQRTAERAHFHLETSLAQAHAHHEGDDDDDDDSAVQRAHDTAGGHHHGHSHSRLAFHAHDLARADVVYVDASPDSMSDGQAHLLKRVSNDLEAVWMRNSPLPSRRVARPRFAEPLLAYCSHIEPPLERPPRPGA